jgi:ketol-acid reductoisomerase
MGNYFNSLSLRQQLEQLGVCEFMDQSEFADGVSALKG